MVGEGYSDNVSQCTRLRVAGCGRFCGEAITTHYKPGNSDRDRNDLYIREKTLKAVLKGCADPK